MEKVKNLELLSDKVKKEHICVQNLEQPNEMYFFFFFF